MSEIKDERDIGTFLVYASVPTGKNNRCDCYTKETKESQSTAYKYKSVKHLAVQSNNNVDCYGENENDLDISDIYTSQALEQRRSKHHSGDLSEMKKELITEPHHKELEIDIKELEDVFATESDSSNHVELQRIPPDIRIHGVPEIELFSNESDLRNEFENEVLDKQQDIDLKLKNDEYSTGFLHAHIPETLLHDLDVPDEPDDLLYHGFDDIHEQYYQDLSDESVYDVNPYISNANYFSNDETNVKIKKSKKKKLLKFIKNKYKKVEQKSSLKTRSISEINLRNLDHNNMKNSLSNFQKIKNTFFSSTSNLDSLPPKESLMNDNLSIASFNVYDRKKSISLDDINIGTLDTLSITSENSLHKRKKFHSEEKRSSISELAQLLSSAKRVTKQSSKGQIFDSLLSVILVEGKNLKAMDSTGLSDPYVRFKLGADKYKSKVCKQTLSPAWHEQFDMKIFTGNGPLPILEVTVWDKDSGKDEFMGRAHLDLTAYEREKSHYLELTLEDQPAAICLYVSITAQTYPGCASDLHSYDEQPDRIIEIHNDFKLYRTLRNFKQIGWLQLKMHRAVGLRVADLGGASDPFAVIELGNQRLVTPTIYKTLNPQWDKVYELTFAEIGVFHVVFKEIWRSIELDIPLGMINDIHDVLEITIFDEDKRGAPEFLGRVQIPLLSVIPWEKRLYQLKDKRLQSQEKGHLIMSLGVVYNPVRASLRTFNPKEERILDEVPRFRRQLLQQNVDRLQNLIRSIIATGEFIQSLFTWKYTLRSAFAFTIYILLVMNFDWFMLPLILFLVLLKNYIVFMLSPNKETLEEDSQALEDDDDDDDDDDKPKKGIRKTFREKLEAINNICMIVQNRMDDVASFGERIKNTFNWTVPFLSYLLMVLLLLGTVVLYIIPLRYLLLAWGINKFTKRIRKPNAIPNNEMLDFLSRIPSDPEVKRRRPLKADVVLR